MGQIAGYLEISKYLFIEEMNAFSYALDQIVSNKDLQQEFVEWFFSGNFIAVCDEELEE